MMAEPKKSQGKGEFTYQVGWKKGTIHKKDGDEAVPMEHQAATTLIHRFIWRQAPITPASFDFYLLCALPVICFISILVLVYLLNQF
jgi:hypothetical protein